NFLLAGLFVISVGLGQAQNFTSPSYKKQTKSSTGKPFTPSAINKNQNPETTKFNVGYSPMKVAAHAPAVNDPAYEAKKEEWMVKYPEEYNAFQQISNGIQGINPESTQGVTVLKQRVAEHAPDPDDPIYDVKKAQWIKNYPEEYKALFHSPAAVNTIVSTHNSNEIKQQIMPTDNRAIEYTPGYKIAIHAPEYNDADYEAKKEEWMAKYPNEYGAAQQIRPDINYTPAKATISGTGQQPQNIMMKAGEHAPYVNDPDYVQKKEQWIINYPDEYKQFNSTTEKSLKEVNAKEICDQNISPIDYGKGGIFEGRNPQDEIVSLRDETSKHFRNANGAADAIITAGMPLNYHENGSWKTIIKEIVPNTTGFFPEFTYGNTTNTTKTYYSGISTGGVLTEYLGNTIREWINPKISWIVNGNLTETVNITNTSGSVNLNKIIYSNCFPGTDVRFTQENGGKKLDIILNNSALLSNIPAGASHLAICETIILPEGWTYRLSQSILFIINEKGLIVFSYAAPEFYDSRPDVQKVEGKYEVKQNNNELAITTLVPTEWLTAKDRVFPIIIDPTATIYATSGGWQCSACPTQYINDVAIIYSGYLSGDHRAWAKFNTSSIADGSAVSSVTLALYCDYAESSNSTTISTYDISTYYGPYGSYSVDYWNDLGDGTNYNSYTVTTAGTYGPSSLGSSASSKLQGQLVSDRFQVGIVNSNTTSQSFAKRFTGSSYIVVTYGSNPTCGSTNLGNISPACQAATASYSSGTVPYWSFSATAGNTYHFSLGSNSEDSYLHLYDASFTELASNDDYGPFWNGMAASLSWTCTTSGTYYIAASHYTCNTFNNSGSIAYWYTTATYESSGATITPSTVWQNQAYSAGNAYWYRFQATAGLIYDFSLCDNSEDSYIRIYDQYWNFQSSADDNGPFCSSVPASISWTCPTSGTYIIQISNFSCDGFINSGNLAYKFQLPCTLGCGDTDMGFLSFSNCSPQDASYNAGTRPFWIFNATSGYTYNFSMGASSEDTYLRLFDLSCSQLAFEDDAGPFTTGLQSSISWTCATTGTYIISASEYSCDAFVNSSYLTYWRSNDPYITTDLATIIPTTSWQNQAYTSGNLSVYRFNATAGLNYDFSLCSNTEDSYIRIYNTTFDLMYSNDDNGQWCTGLAASMSFNPPSTGDYIIEISHFGCNGFTNSGTLAYRYCNPPAAPSPVTASPSTICIGGSSNLNATSAGNTIQWYTDASGGSPFGTTASGVNFSVSPAVTTTYYAESQSGGTAGGGAAYYIRAQSGEPWGYTNNVDAMNNVYGSGNWTLAYFENAVPATVFSAGTDFVYMDGSDAGADEMETFLNANITTIQNWVSAGNYLVLKSAPNEGDGMSYGFGGTSLVYDGSLEQTYGYAVNTSHQVFNYPFTPCATSFTGNYISHAYITGSGITSLMIGENTYPMLAEKTWGSGKVLFSGMTLSDWWDPETEADNLLYNIIYYIAQPSGCESTTRTPVTVSVVNDPIATASGNTSICEGNTALYTVSCTGGTGTPTYQWYFKSPSGSWSALTNGSSNAPCYASVLGATSANLTLGLYSFASACSGYQVYCVVTYSISGCNSTSSNIITTTVTPSNTITLTAGGTQTKCINTAITTTTYATTGATGASVTGLPSGVTGSFASNVVTISGTPTVSGAYTYTVTLSGGCGVISTTGTITVTPNNTISLTAGGTQTKCINTAITSTTYSTTGATGASVTGLPAGVTGAYASNVVTISGTPTVSGAYTYTVTLNGGCGVISTTGTITVTPNNTISLTAGGTQTKCINTPITTTSYTTTGATGATITGLPTGVTGSFASNVVTISGTPTISGAYTYTVTLNGGCGAISTTGTITVTPDNTISLTAGGTQTKCINTAITTTTYATTGATGASVTGLPSGVTGSFASNVVTISGTPTVSGAYT
ncbi:MAG TPA: hypothetical protein PKH58_11470, partial [Paludibacteraceae bacterium]|nr:hypothetical protein [Paludibacteraceae bacterium]